MATDEEIRIKARAYIDDLIRAALVEVKVREFLFNFSQLAFSLRARFLEGCLLIANRARLCRVSAQYHSVCSHKTFCVYRELSEHLTLRVNELQGQLALNVKAAVSPWDHIETLPRSVQQ